MKAIDIFRQLLLRISFLPKRYKNVPGEVIKDMSEEQRQKLSELKSDEIDPSLRVEEWWLGDDNYHQGQENRKYLLNFDKKILK
jgi:hypothetical protein